MGALGSGPVHIHLNDTDRHALADHFGWGQAGLEHAEHTALHGGDLDRILARVHLADLRHTPTATLATAAITVLAITGTGLAVLAAAVARDLLAG